MNILRTVFCVLAVASSGMAYASDTVVIPVDDAVAVIARKLAAYDAGQPDKAAYPNEAKGATWSTVPAKDWVSGFYPGALWYTYEFAKRRNWPDQEAWRQRADTWTVGLTAEQFTTTNHDLGFMLMDSFGHAYRLTGEPRYKAVVLQAATSLAKRYRPEVGLIRSWGNIDDMKQYTVIIDNMMNLELLLWASANGGTTEGGTSQDLVKIATHHADRSIIEFFRPDDSTYHVVDLDPMSGAVTRKHTHQGKADDSCWSRGQTWAIYGYAYMYEATKDRRYLEQSIKAADYYLAHLPADHVPPSDFNSELTGLEFKDSSAAAIACCAFFRLSRLSDDPATKTRFRQAATDTLGSLTKAPYFSASPDKASALVYQARNYHPDASHRLTNTSLIWGDYYLLEALLAYDASRP
jgi:unsaturated chondroitin disaccharide hydrolase